MANFSKWKTCIPRWEGNELDPDPFKVEVKRLSVDERAAFDAELKALDGNPDDSIGKLLGRYMRGPFGNLSFEGVPFTGDLPALVDGMFTADPVGYTTLTACLMKLLVEVNDVGGKPAQG